MKKMLVLLVLFFGTAAYAQMPPAKGRMGMGQDQMPMMQTGMPMMQHMMAQQAMYQNVLQMMMEMARIQERMLGESLAPAEKKRLTGQLDEIQKRISSMMVAPVTGMTVMPQTGSDPRLQCAERYLQEAITIQTQQMKDPAKVTHASEADLMQRLKNAYGCIQEPTPAMTPEGMPQAGDAGQEEHHK
ncbi:MAG: hypothetical protein V1736_04290 [Pseudomonadota bacterium]